MSKKTQSTLTSRSITLPFLILISIGGFYLWSEHRVDFIAFSPVLVLLFCPILLIALLHSYKGQRSTHEDPSNH